MAEGGKGSEAKFKVNDRVRRLKSEGSLGIVKELRYESTASKSDAKEKNPIVGVQWDNGTFSFFTPEGLEHSK